MKNPVFAYGTLEKLKSAVESGRLTYPAYCWVHDTLQYAFVNKNGLIELVGIPKLTGTLDEEIILSNLSDGIYQVQGQHRITETSEPVYLSASYILVIIATDGETKKVRRITADEIENYDVSEGEAIPVKGYITSDYLIENGYTTETYVDEKTAALEISLRTELKQYVDSVVAEQVATLVPEEIDKYIQTVPESDVNDLFTLPSV